MRRSNHTSDLFAAFVSQVADALAERLAPALRNGAASATTVQRRSGGKGRKRDMRCRVQRCRNKSKGPRFRFLCEEHLKLPKNQQEAALEKWKATKVA